MFLETILGAVTALLTAVGAYYKFQSKKMKDDPVQESIDRNVIVDDILEEVLNHTAADRAFIFQFKNGGRYYTGNTIQRFMNTHEVVTTGISQGDMYEKSYQVSNFSKFLRDLFTEEFICSTDTTFMKDYPSWKTLMVNQGNLAFLVVPIRHRGAIIGFLGISQVKHRNFKCERHIDFLKEQSTKISGELNTGKDHPKHSWLAWGT